MHENAWKCRLTSRRAGFAALRPEFHCNGYPTSKHDRENEAFCCVNIVLKLPAASYPRQDTLLSQVEDGFVTVLLVFAQMMYLSCIQSFSLSVSTSQQFCALWALWVAKHEASVGQECIQVSPCMAMETCFCSIVDIASLNEKSVAIWLPST